MEATSNLILRDWGGEVRAARKALGLTQVAAADRAGIDQSTLSKIENGGYRNMTPAMVLRLCLAFSMDPERSFRWPRAVIEMARMKGAA